MMPLDLRRRFFAEEIEAVARLKSPALVDAFAAIPRERFLPPGPWTIVADVDFGMGGPARTRQTADADPARVYHNIAVAIDPARQLFNGQPSTIGAWMDMLELAPGQRLVHIGAGLGYFTALMGHCVTPAGRVVAYEVDEGLAAQARENLSDMPWIDVRHGDASRLPDDPKMFDAVVVNAGATHPLNAWLDRLAVGGRMVLPLTTTMAALGGGSTAIGKGLVFLVTRDESAFLARAAGVVMIYSAVGIRDETLSPALGKAMMMGPAHWQQVARLRRDPHDQKPTCWYHGQNFCLAKVQSEP